MKGSTGYELGLDLVLVIGSVLVLNAAPASEPHWHDLAWFVAASAVIWIAGAALFRPYDREPQRSALEESAVAVLMTLPLIALAWVVVPGTGAVAAAAFQAIILLPALIGARLGMRAREPRRQDVVIAGDGPLVPATARMLSESPRTVVRAQVDSRDLEKCLRTIPVDEVYVAGGGMQEAVRVCEQLGVAFALPAWLLRVEHARPARRHGVGDGYLHFLHVEPSLQLDLKHIADRAMAAAALAVLSLPLAIVAVLIKLGSRGPVFFRQERVGARGRPFKMLKFRSMVTGAESLRAAIEAQNEQSGPVFKIREDPRVTRIGRILRKYSVDELPQLVNVARGEMSLVGPRPPLSSEVEKYEPWQLRRLSVRPGLTCIWQVAGRNQIEFAEWMLLDLRYIDTWSLRQDLRLLLQTVPAVVGGRGAS
ncbi:MAG: exopolysaccharide biosynthesis polyprenyl glycosylphosphotransferase [Deltaproteobacteria bacterium]